MLNLVLIAVWRWYRWIPSKLCCHAWHMNLKAWLTLWMASCSHSSGFHRVSTVCRKPSENTQEIITNMSKTGAGSKRSDWQELFTQQQQQQQTRGKIQMLRNVLAVTLRRRSSSEALGEMLQLGWCRPQQPQNPIKLVLCGNKDTHVQQHPGKLFPLPAVLLIDFPWLRRETPDRSDALKLVVTVQRRDAAPEASF